MNSKKKNMFVTISLLFIMLFPIKTLAFSDSFTTSVTDNAFCHGNGTEEDPYLIYSETDLRKIGNDESWTLEKSYKLMVDIILAKPTNGQSNWVPIGTFGDPYELRNLS